MVGKRKVEGKGEEVNETDRDFLKSVSAILSSLICWLRCKTANRKYLKIW